MSQQLSSLRLVSLILSPPGVAGSAMSQLGRDLRITTDLHRERSYLFEPCDSVAVARPHNTLTLYKIHIAPKPDSVLYLDTSIMEAVLKEVRDVSILKRLLFATAYIPKEMPGYWEVVARFGCPITVEGFSLSPESARVTMESLEFLDINAFCMEPDLVRELINMEYGPNKQPFGIPLVPKQMDCLLCGSKLLLKSDRPSRITIYTNSLGTVPATHYHKYCSKYRKGCKFVQYYGYSKSGHDGCARYDDECLTLPYFISSQETGFDLTMLKNFDAELLIGQISYKQKADIYNINNGYDTTKKGHSLVSQDDVSKTPRVQPVHG